MAEPAETKKLDKIAQGVSDLTYNIPKEEGGSRPEGHADTWHTLDVGLDTKGRHFYIYSFDAPEPRSKGGREQALSPTSFSPKQRDTMRQAMNVLEGVSNVYFVEAGKKNTYVPTAKDCKPEDAHLCFFADKISDLKNVGAAGGMENRSGGRDIVIFNKNTELSTYLHELSHAIGGLSHPKNNIKQGGYNLLMTIMSNRGPENGVVNFGVIDGAAWQHILGKSKSPILRKGTIDGVEALASPVINRDVPVTLDLSNLKGSNPLMVDLSQDVGRHIHNYVIETLDGERSELNMVVMPGTKIKKLVAPQDVPTYMKGSAGTHLVGNSRNDVMMAHGGRNTFTGGGNGDSFRFDKESGLNNTITDFHAKQDPNDILQEKERNDKIQFVLPDLDHLEMRLRKDKKGTDIKALDKDKQPLTSVFVANKNPEELMDHVFKTQIGEWSSFHDRHRSKLADLEIIKPGTPPIKRSEPAVPPPPEPGKVFEAQIEVPNKIPQAAKPPRKLRAIDF